MAHWPERTAWIADYKAHKKKVGFDENQMAALLGVKLDSLANYKRANGSRPPEWFIRKSAEIFGTSPYLYMPDPRVKDALTPFPEWIVESLSRMARAMDGSALPPDKWALYIDNALSDARFTEAVSETSKKKR